MKTQGEKNFFEKTMELPIDMKIELIKEQIAQGEYQINSRLIAEEMLKKQIF